MNIMPDIDPAGNSFSALQACSGVQLDLDPLLHVLHINGLSRCVYFPAPGAATAPGQQWRWLLARRSSGT
jgi:hypothetical protein